MRHRATTWNAVSAIVRRHGIGFFLSAHWVPNVSAVGRQDYESLEAFSNILSIVKKNYVEDVETKNSGQWRDQRHAQFPRSA